MGYNSVVLVLNDRLNEISKPDFGRKLADAIRESAGTHEHIELGVQHGQTQVLVVAHADIMQVVAVGGNTGRILGTGSWDDTDEQLLRKLAKRAGFRLVPENQKETSPAKKPTLDEVKALAKEYGWRCVILRRKSKK